jgi:hypothetical protein
MDVYDPFSLSTYLSVGMYTFPPFAYCGNAAVNMGVQIPALVPAFISLGVCTRKWNFWILW